MDSRRIIKELSDNLFINELLGNSTFDEEEYRKFIDILLLLENQIHNVQYIEKELALLLYSAEQIIRNRFIGITDIEKKEKLEEAWIEVDQIIHRILYN